MENHIGSNRCDAFRQSWIAHVPMILERRDRPTALRLGAKRSRDRSTYKARMAREEQVGHGN